MFDIWSAMSLSQLNYISYHSNPDQHFMRVSQKRIFLHDNDNIDKKLDCSKVKIIAIV